MKEIHKSVLVEKQHIDDLVLLKNLGAIRVGNRHYYDYNWECRCKCGKKIVIRENSLLNKDHYHSCGCYQNKYLTPGDDKRISKAGKARAQKRNKDGCNVDMLLRDKTISSNTSGIQGVSWSSTANKWHVYVGYKNRRATLGYFEDISDAKKIREMGIEAVKNGDFEEFFFKVRGKEYRKTYKEQKKG